MLLSDQIQDIIKEYRNELSQNQTEISNLTTIRDDLLKEIDTLKLESAKFKARNDIANQELVKSGNTIKVLLNEKECLKKDLDIYEKKFYRKSDETLDLNSQIEKLQKKINSFEQNEHLLILSKQELQKTTSDLTKSEKELFTTANNLRDSISKNEKLEKTIKDLETANKKLVNKNILLISENKEKEKKLCSDFEQKINLIDEERTKALNNLSELKSTLKKRNSKESLLEQEIIDLKNKNKKLIADHKNAQNKVNSSIKEIDAKPEVVKKIKVSNADPNQIEKEFKRQLGLKQQLEFERQIESLKTNQERVIKENSDLVEKLQLEKNNFTAKSNQFEAEIVKLKEELHNFQALADKLQSELKDSFKTSSIKTRNKRLEQKIQELQDQITILKDIEEKEKSCIVEKTKSEFTTRIKQLEKDLNQFQSKIERLEESNRSLSLFKDQNSGLNEQIQNFRKQNQDLKDELKSEKAIQATFTSKLQKKTLEDSKNTDELTKIIEKLNSEIEEIREKNRNLSSFKSQSIKLNQQLKEAETKVRALENEKTESIEAIKTTFTNKFKKETDRLTKKLDEVCKRAQELKEQNDYLKTYEEQVAKLKPQEIALQKQVNLLKEEKIKSEESLRTEISEKFKKEKLKDLEEIKKLTGFLDERNRAIESLREKNDYLSKFENQVRDLENQVIYSKREIDILKKEQIEEVESLRTKLTDSFRNETEQATETLKEANKKFLELKKDYDRKINLESQNNRLNKEVKEFQKRINVLEEEKTKSNEIIEKQKKSIDKFQKDIIQKSVDPEKTDKQVQELKEGSYTLSYRTQASKLSQMVEKLQKKVEQLEEGIREQGIINENLNNTFKKRQEKDSIEINLLVKSQKEANNEIEQLREENNYLNSFKNGFDKLNEEVKEFQKQVNILEEEKSKSEEILRNKFQKDLEKAKLDRSKEIVNLTTDLKEASHEIKILKERNAELAPLEKNVNHFISRAKDLENQIVVLEAEKGQSVKVIKEKIIQKFQKEISQLNESLRKANQEIQNLKETNNLQINAKGQNEKLNQEIKGLQKKINRLETEKIESNKSFSNKIEKAKSDNNKAVNRWEKILKKRDQEVKDLQTKNTYLGILENQSIELKQTLKELEKEIDSLKDEKIKSEESFKKTLDNTIKKSKVEKKKEIDQLTKTLNEKDQEVKDLEQKNSQFDLIKDQNTELKKSIKKLEQKVSYLNDENADLKEYFDNKLKELKAEYSKGIEEDVAFLSRSLNEKIEKIKDLEEKEAQLLSSKKQITVLEQSIKALEQKVSHLKDENVNSKEFFDNKLKELKAEHSKEIDLANKSLNEKIQKIEELKEQNKLIDSFRNQITNLKQSIKRLNQEKNGLEEEKVKYENTFTTSLKKSEIEDSKKIDELTKVLEKKNQEIKDLEEKEIQLLSAKKQITILEQCAKGLQKEANLLKDEKVKAEKSFKGILADGIRKARLEDSKEIDQLTKNLSEINDEVEKLKEQNSYLSHFKDRNSQLNQKFKESQKEIDSLKDELELKENKEIEFNKEKDKLQKEIDMSIFKSRKHKECEDSLKDTQAELNRVIERLKSADNKQTELQNKINGLESRRKENEDQINQLKGTTLENTKLQHELEEANAKLRSAEFNQSQIRSRAAKREKEVATLAKDIERIKESLEASDSEKTTLLVERKKMQGYMTTQEKELEDLGNRARAAEQELKELKESTKESLKKKDEEIAALKKEKVNQESELKEIEAFLTKNKPKKRKSTKNVK